MTNIRESLIKAKQWMWLELFTILMFLRIQHLLTPEQLFATIKHLPYT
jgi:hypothetical protein